MHRTYRPINHPISSLHIMLEHLVCEVWCNASADNTCQELLSEEFEIIYLAYQWLKKDINAVYEKCKTLDDKQRADIREAFYINNRIEDLCNGEIQPIEFASLPEFVEEDIQPLMKLFYTPLLDRATVPGDKLDYYNLLVQENGYKTCPCCGLVKIESPETRYTEDNDHFFPIAHYPFAAVNFKNLVPACDKCNKKHKGSKKPLDHNGVAYYAFANRQPIEINITIADNADLDYSALKADDIQLSFSEDPDKNATWNWLFNIEERYNQEVRDLSFNELRTLKRRFIFNKDRNPGTLYEDVLDFEIANYEADIYDEKKFLKASFLKAIKQKPEWMAVYV